MFEQGGMNIANSVSLLQLACYSNILKTLEILEYLRNIWSAVLVI